MKITTIVFDFGNVLIGWDPRRVYRPVLAGDAEIDQFFEEVGFDDWNLEQDRGRSWQDAVSELSTRFPHRSELIRRYHANWSDSITGPIEGSVRILERLHRNGYRLVGLTNWSETFQPTRPKYAWFDLFDDIIVSSEVGLVKPDRAIFELTLQRIGRPASECVFIDDNESNVAAAAALGFHTIRFQSPEQLDSDLKRIGVA